MKDWTQVTIIWHQNKLICAETISRLMNELMDKQLTDNNFQLSQIKNTSSLSEKFEVS